MIVPYVTEHICCVSRTRALNRVHAARVRARYATLRSAIHRASASYRRHSDPGRAVYGIGTPGPLEAPGPTPSPHRARGQRSLGSVRHCPKRRRGEDVSAQSEAVRPTDSAKCTPHCPREPCSISRTAVLSPDILRHPQTFSDTLGSLPLGPAPRACSSPGSRVGAHLPHRAKRVPAHPVLGSVPIRRTAPRACRLTRF